MPIITNFSANTVNVSFICSGPLEMISSLHVISNPSHHFECGEWCRWATVELDHDLLKQIISFGNRYNNWSFVMDIADINISEKQSNDFDMLIYNIKKMNHVDFAYVFLGATLVESKEIIEDLIENPGNYSSEKLSYALQYIKEDNIIHFLNNSHAIKNEMLRILEKYSKSFFEQYWMENKDLYTDQLNEERNKFEHSNPLNYILDLHKDLEYRDNVIVMKKQSEFAVNIEDICEIKIFFSMFTHPHLMINIYLNTVSIYKNLNMPQARLRYEQLSSSARAFSDITRLAIVKMLLHKPYVNKDIATCLGISPVSVSQHIKILKGIGIVDAFRNKNFIYYSINKEALNKCFLELSKFLELTNYDS